MTEAGTIWAGRVLETNSINSAEVTEACFPVNTYDTSAGAPDGRVVPIVAANSTSGCAVSDASISPSSIRKTANLDLEIVAAHVFHGVGGGCRSSDPAHHVTGSVHSLAPDYRAGLPRIDRHSSLDGR